MFQEFLIFSQTPTPAPMLRSFELLDLDLFSIFIFAKNDITKRIEPSLY